MGGAFEISGGASLSTSCGMMVNSDASNALRQNGGGCVTGDVIDITGGYSGSCFSKPPTTQVPREDDPLAYFPEPVAPSGCDYTKLKVNAGNATLSPGVYCGGIDILTTGTVTLNPGIYYLMGGGLSISSGATVIGNGVCFYNSFRPGLPFAYAPININGGATVKLSAPVTGPMAGILFFQDRTIVDHLQSNRINGNSQSFFQGTIYFPSQEVMYAGTSGIDGYTVLVANNLKIVGNSVIKNYQPGQPLPPPPMKQGALVE
jgi:hypothetical protein